MIVWIILIALEIYRNYWIIEVKKSKPNYLISFILRGMVAILHGVYMDLMFDVFPGNAWEKSAIQLLIMWAPLLVFQITSFWLLFDLGLNIARKKHPLHYGKANWIDKYLGGMPVYYILKLFALIACVVSIIYLYP